MSEQSRGQRQGLLYGAAAYGLWGLFPLYWPLLEPAGAIEILAHRVVWSAVLVVALIIGLHRSERIRAVLRNRDARVALGVGAAVIGFNWGTYIWGVNNGHVVETSLGYYINPLFTVLLGVLVLGERLRRVQWTALAIAFLAVVVLTVELGHPPWVSLVLAVSFGTYGLAKKQAGVGALEGLTVETVLLSPVALLYLTFTARHGDSHFVASGMWHTILLVSTGLVTAVPLLCFGASATRVSLTTLGMLQYLAPTIQFALGLAVFHEQMSAQRWVGLALVWAALVLFTVESVRHHRRQPQAVAGYAPV